MLSSHPQRVASPDPIGAAAALGNVEQLRLRRRRSGRSEPSEGSENGGKAKESTSANASKAFDCRTSESGLLSLDNEEGVTAATARSSQRSRSSIDSRASFIIDSPDAPFALPAQATAAASSSSSKRRKSQTSQSSFDTYGAPINGSLAARYVTVSSILSRSGVAVALSSEHALPLQEGDVRSFTRRMSRDSASHAHHTDAGPSTSKRISNGSALEALGALFLQRDSTGRVSNLSFTRDDRRREDKRSHAKEKTSRSMMLSSISRGLSGSVTRLGIRMPREGEAGETIAQRRARKGTLDQSERDRPLRIERTQRNEPTFEVSIVNPTYPTLFSPNDPPLDLPPPPAPKLKGTDGEGMTPPPLDEPDYGEDERRPHPRTILRAPLTEPSSIYGAGSAFSWIEPPELPPSPVGMPGAWLLGGSGGWSRDRLEEGALLLPPPLLDDGSDAQSFEGLLGVRRMREQERARKQMDKLKARNRPAHKVGMLTAFSNFVRAAHAADKATRAATANARRVPLQRRHTEPAANVFVEADADVAAEDDDERASQEPIVLHSAQMSRSTSSQADNSNDSVGRQLHTVFEARLPTEYMRSSKRRRSTGKGEEQEEDDDDNDMSDLDEIGVGRRASIDSVGRRNIVRQLVPVHMSSTKAEQQEHTEIDDFSLDGPATPRIVPTLLSLPPSPWTPYGGGARSGAQTPFHVHLGMTHVVGGIPGTPRLMPALLEVMPSPFPTAAGMTPFVRSPRIRASRASSTASSIVAPSPLALSPHESPRLHTTMTNSVSASQSPTIRRRKTTGGLPPFLTGEEQGRLTPSASMAMLLEQQQSTPTKTTTRAKSPHVVAVRPTKQRSSSTTTTTRKRSFLLWFLFGDLGLGSRAKIAARAAGSSSSSSSSSVQQTCISFAAHTYGFGVFVLAHLVDLSYRIAEFLAMMFWFFRWMTLNLTGQTLLARCVIEAYALVAREWETVSREDHEGKGTRANKSNEEDDASVKFRGLSKWQVLKGLIELACLQDVTRERYLKEGAGLQELRGALQQRRKSSTIEPDSGGGVRGRIDLGAMRAADRKHRARVESETNDTQDEDDDEQSESETSSSSSSDDDDMVVTRRGPDILEFTKTPKVERHSYFSSSMSEDDNAFMTSKTSKRPSLRRAGRRTTFSNDDEREGRQMVKMIKWASRLAISAYGLHVTLVDLPATFTPSGDRFSRQTFAHLSRLHHEDVLHADIQTLDSDDYSPTFYLVRDLTRKVVVVSVRGTQSLQDIIVDLEMVVGQVKLHVDEGDEDDDEPLYCHAGVLRAAKALIARGSTLFKTLNEALRENPDFGIVFTGHSLGGAIASTVVLLLSQFEKVTAAAEGRQGGTGYDHVTPGRWLTHDTSGLPAGRTIRAITFAHPATFSAKLANRAAQGTTPLVLSVVLGHDIIPRCGHGQARELRRVLGALSRVRRRKEGGKVSLDSKTHAAASRTGSTVAAEDDDDNDHDNDEEDDARVHVFTSWRAWRNIKSKGADASREEVRRARRIEEELWHLRCDVENDLYANIKKRTDEARRQSSKNTPPHSSMLDAEHGDDEGDEDDNIARTRSRPVIPPSPWMEPWQRAKAPLHQLAARRQALDAVTLANEESVSQSAGVLVPGGRSIWLYEDKLYQITSPLSFFSLPDFHSKMFSEHFPSAYEDALEKL